MLILLLYFAGFNNLYGFVLHVRCDFSHSFNFENNPRENHVFHLHFTAHTTNEKGHFMDCRLQNFPVGAYPDPPSMTRTYKFLVDILNRHEVSG